MKIGQKCLAFGKKRLPINTGLISMKKKLNVLFPFFFREFMMGGVSKYLVTLTSNFQNINAFDLEGNIGHNKQVFKKNSFVQSVYRKLSIIATFFSIRKIVRINKIDIVHLNPSLIFNALLREYFRFIVIRNKVKTLVFFHGWNPENEYLLIRYPFFKKLFEADQLIVLSSTIKNRLIAFGVVPDKIIIGRTMVDENFMKWVPEKNINNKKQLLFLSRVEKAKGIYEVLEAYKSLKENNKDGYCLAIAGVGSELENVIKYIGNNKLKDVKILGFIDGEEKIKLFMDSDIYLFPSYTEGMPISVLEAMSMGLPVITTKVGGLPDFFEHGEMGFFVEVKSIDEIYTYVELLAQDINLAKKIGDYNIAYARNRFAPSTVVKEIENTYYNMM